jgi:hypothetical protein
MRYGEQRVKMLTDWLYSTPEEGEGKLCVDQVVDVPANIAATWIAKGIAKAV